MKTPLSKVRRIALTTGDVQGIGFEVTAKALSALSSKIKKEKVIFFLFRKFGQEKKQPEYFNLIDKKYTRLSFNSLDAALGFLSSIEYLEQLPKNTIIDLCLKESEAFWVYLATLACKHNLLHSLVTGPLSKTASVRLPNKPIGHTGIFRQVFPKNKMHMAFIGQHFNVLLATDHIAFSEVEKKLIRSDFKSALSASVNLKTLLKSKKPIGLLGLSPHAGEQGLIGQFEKKYLKNLNKDFVEGPLVPDAAFLKKNWSKYCVYLCLYHDQGLIPFKMLHGQDSGVHITMGLPFVRTSVDHGTAIDIYNQDLANAHSMRDAILLNLKLTRS